MSHFHVWWLMLSVGVVGGPQLGLLVSTSDLSMWLLRLPYSMVVEFQEQVPQENKT